VAVVEQRTPVLRAALMAAIVVMVGFFFSALGVIEFRCDCGVTTASGEAVGAGRFELSTFVFGNRMYRRVGLALDGSDGAAVCAGSARMA
jgi:hypothetical protein